MAEAIDATGFLRGLRLADERVRRGAARGIQRLMGRVEKRAKDLAPILTGTLAASIHADYAGMTVTDQEVSGRVAAGGGESADYAIRQHEEPMHHTHPVEGTYASKYMEKAVTETAGQAGPVIAEEVRKELGG
jgi:hypothetical protein